MTTEMTTSSPTTAEQSGLASVNGIKLWYEIRGSGRPLVLLHGGFGSVEMFGSNLGALAAGRQVISVDLQGHGRSPVPDRPMRFETMADDIAALIRELGIVRADVVGFSLGGGVALRTAIQHPDVVDRIVLVSTPFRSTGWLPEQRAAMQSMAGNAAVVEMLGQSPLGATYRAIAPQPADWPKLVEQVTTLLADDYDWMAEASNIPAAVLLVAGDADGIAPRHVVECFEALGGGLHDASWDRSGMTRHRMAILPGVTHYDINVHPLLATTVAAFLDEA
jgi:pimeloyl-ACP methyl ester carboxylesterase